MKIISGFKGEYRWLSNFWPCDIVHDGITYPSVEHAYQSFKTQDKEIKRKIAYECTAGEAKRLGKNILLDENWEKVKIYIMYSCLLHKFGNKDLALKLINTKDALIVEENTWNDKFWGVCDGEGHNVLGNLIMAVRTMLFASNKELGK